MSRDEPIAPDAKKSENLIKSGGFLGFGVFGFLGFFGVLGSSIVEAAIKRYETLFKVDELFFILESFGEVCEPAGSYTVRLGLENGVFEK